MRSPAAAISPRPRAGQAGGHRDAADHRRRHGRGNPAFKLPPELPRRCAAGSSLPPDDEPVVEELADERLCAGRARRGSFPPRPPRLPLSATGRRPTGSTSRRRTARGGRQRHRRQGGARSVAGRRGQPRPAALCRRSSQVAARRIDLSQMGDRSPRRCGCCSPWRQGKSRMVADRRAAASSSSRSTASCRAMRSTQPGLIGRVQNEFQEAWRGICAAVPRRGPQGARGAPQRGRDRGAPRSACSAAAADRA